MSTKEAAAFAVRVWAHYYVNATGLVCKRASLNGRCMPWNSSWGNSLTATPHWCVSLHHVFFCPSQSVIIISTMSVSCSLNTLLHQSLKPTQAVMAAAPSRLCRWKWGSFLFKGSVRDLAVWVYFQKSGRKEIQAVGGWDELGLIFFIVSHCRMPPIVVPPVRVTHEK